MRLLIVEDDPHIAELLTDGLTGEGYACDRAGSAAEAGVGQMPSARFLSYNVAGGLLWALSVPLLGAWLGGLIPHLDRYILLVGGAVLLSLIPVGLELRKLRAGRS